MSAAAVAILVEYEPQIRRFVRSALESENWRVLEAGTLKRGLSETAARRPDLVVLDRGAAGRRRYRLWEGINPVFPGHQ
jgi:two-component system, OmpR family, KDP operon response regulator KdpE